MIIAVDGPAASGKGTLARKIAEQNGYAYLDTGLLYRAVARDVKQAGGSPEVEADAVAAAHALDLETLSDPALRLVDIADAASVVASHPALREALLELQRTFARRHADPGAVLDGRDIGTVICPDADVKLFITASVEARAERRFLELKGHGETISREDILAAIIARDKRDRERSQSPMRPAEDALLLDTTNLDRIETLDAADELIRRKISQEST